MSSVELPGHVVRWNIDEEVFTRNMIQAFSSPPFSIKYLAAYEICTTWALFLTMDPFSEERTVKICICRMDKNKLVDSISGCLHVYLKGQERDKLFITTQEFFTTLDNPLSTKNRFFNVDERVTNKNEKLEIICEVKLFVDYEDLVSRVFDEDVAQLSRDMSAMYSKKEFCDFILRSGHKHFKVHKSVIAARMKVLFKDQKLAGKSELELPLSPDSLEILIQYLYPATPFNIPRRNHCELSQFAREFQVEWLDCLLKNCPKETTYKTHTVSQQLRLDYDLKEVKTWVFKRHLKVLPTDSLRVSDLMLNFECATTDEGFKFLQVSMQFSDMIQTHPIFMRCEIDLLDTKGDIILPRPPEVQATFVLCPILNLSPFLNEHHFHGGPQEPTSLRFNIFLQEMGDTRRVCEEVPLRMKAVTLVDSVGFSLDMEMLVKSPYYYDIIVECHGMRLRLHKGVLYARSATFRQLLEKAKMLSNAPFTINFDVVPRTVLGTALAYIYTGKCKVNDIESALVGYNAGEFFGLPLLKQKCKEYLAKK